MSWVLAKVPIDLLAVKDMMRVIVVRHFRTLNNENRCISKRELSRFAERWKSDLARIPFVF